MSDKKDDLELAYYAGFFDGEGSVGIYGNKFIVCISNTDTGPLRRAQELWGGSLYVQQRATVRGAVRDLWRWEMGGNNARPFLEDIRPYIRAKAQQVDVFLCTLPHKPEGRGSRRTPEAHAIIQRADAELRRLKRVA